MAWGWYIPLGLLGVFILVLFFRVRVGFVYTENFEFWFAIGPFKIRLYPVKKHVQTKTKKKVRKKAPKPPANQTKEKSRLTWTQILSYVRFGLESVGVTGRILRIDNLMIHIVIGGEEAARTAIEYGVASAALSSFYPAVVAKVRVLQHDLSVDADFGGKSGLEADIIISGMLLSLMISGWKVLFRYFKLQKQHTGKAVTP